MGCQGHHGSFTWPYRRQAIETVVEQLGKARIPLERERTRIVIEKPFGRDLASAKVSE